MSKTVDRINGIKLKGIDDIDYIAAIRRLAGKELSEKDKEDCKKFDQLCDEVADGKKSK